MKPLDYTEFNPRAGYFEMDEVVYELKPLSLWNRVWITNKFATKDERDGIVVFSKLIQNYAEEPRAILDVCYRLMEDNKHHFKNESEFRKSVLARKEIEQISIVNSITLGLARSFGVSEPDLEDIEGDTELKKFKAAAALEKRPVSLESLMLWPRAMAIRLNNFMT